MKHIYAVQNPEAQKKRRREIITAEINILRKFEGRSMIEDRVEEQMSKLHMIWFGARPSKQ